jgi:hypothetical protein
METWLQLVRKLIGVNSTTKKIDSYKIFQLLFFYSKVHACGYDELSNVFPEKVHLKNEITFRD